MKLNDKLKALEKYPFHMPGHKRNPKFKITGSEIDITEIDGFDNLHSPNGVLLDIEKRLGEIYKSKKSYMLVNGSTVGILAAVFAVCSEGDKVIVARNCHKSVFNACFIRKVKIVYIEPEFDCVSCCYTSISQDRADKLLLENPDAKAIIVTSPTYEGYISRIKTDIPFIIDAAHGAHLGFASFPAYPKGSIVISSLHKTLPALTQTAVLNVYDEKYITPSKLYLDIFETSSPSYILMNSVDVCCDCLKSCFTEKFFEKLADLRLTEFTNLRVKYSDDPLKLVISTTNTNITAAELAKILRNKYKIEPEMVSLNYVVFIITAGDEPSVLDALKNTLLEIDSGLFKQREPVYVKPPVPCGICEITYPEKTQETPFENCKEKISAEYVFAYPPGIPIIIPNEIITKKALNYLSALKESGVELISDSGLIPNKILTKAED